MKLSKLYSKGLLRDRKKVVSHENSSDKLYVNFFARCYLIKLIEFINQNKSIALFSKSPRSFRRDFNYSGVLFYNSIQIGVLSNDTLTQFQFNLTQVSYLFILGFIQIFTKLGEVTISCLHCHVDVEMDFVDVLKNFRPLRFRNADTFSNIERSISCKKGELEFQYQTEYHGKGKVISIYDKSKQVKECKKELLKTKSIKTLNKYLKNQITRIEVKFENKDVVPVRLIEQLPFLYNRNIFNNCWLRIDDSRETLSAGEIKLLDSLDKLLVDLNLSLAVGLKIAKKRHSDSEWKMLTRALNKSSRVHYNFEKAFEQNWKKYLKKKLSVHEIELLEIVRAKYYSKFYVEHRHTDSKSFKTYKPIHSLGSVSGTFEISANPELHPP